jgi:hypothetical protein
MSPRVGLAKLALGHVRTRETASVAPDWASNLGNPKHGISADKRLRAMTRSAEVVVYFRRSRSS